MENNDETLINTASRSISRKVADYLTEIEEAMELGVSQKDIIKYLGKQGITVTYLNFRSILQRLRAKKRKGKVPKQITSIASPIQADETAVQMNSPASKVDIQTLGEKKVTKHEPIITKSSSSGVQKTWREIKNEKVEW